MPGFLRSRWGFSRSGAPNSRWRPDDSPIFNVIPRARWLHTSLRVQSKVTLTTGSLELPLAHPSHYAGSFIMIVLKRILVP